MRLDPVRFSRELRRAATVAAMRGAILASRPLPPRTAIRLGTTLGVAAGAILPLRHRLRKNLELGLGHVPPGVVTQYLRNLGLHAGWSLAIYHHGFWNSTVPDRLGFHESVANLDEAVARGRGVVLASPHLFCYESGAAYINGRHRVVAVARESQDRARQALKQRWYEAAGLQIAYRPRRASLLEDTTACLRVLKTGRILAITPDLIVPPPAGVRVRIFGRETYLPRGIVVLAARMRAPLVTVSAQWQQDGRLLIRFSRPIEYPRTADRERTALEGLQAWCRDFEEYLRANPADWMFWLDKRWTRVLRTSPAARVSTAISP
jgi:KDO2-lipid IV(A) lauroyltransferase